MVCFNVLLCTVRYFNSRGNVGISLLWGYSLGGIGKVAITYGKLHEISNIKVRTIVVQPQSVEVDLSSLNKLDSKVVPISSRFDFSFLNHKISLDQRSIID